MGSDGFSPVGLRVLVVDRDISSMNSLVKHLTESNYLVTTCNKIDDALKMVKHTEIAIVMTDVNMGDNIDDGFEFLTEVAQDLDFPVILMTENGDTDIVKRGIRSGACGYLQKPITDKDVRFIWQHVFHKRELGENNHGWIGFNGDSGKRELGETSHAWNGFNGDSSKRVRTIWTEELHNHFLNAIAQIKSSADKRLGPKRILERMKEQMKELSLTEQQVASHLQKHRGKNSGSQPQAQPDQYNIVNNDQPQVPYQSQNPPNVVLDQNPNQIQNLSNMVLDQNPPNVVLDAPHQNPSTPDTYCDSEDQYFDIKEYLCSTPNNDVNTLYE